MDRTIGKSQTRNNDGERQMSLAKKMIERNKWIDDFKSAVNIVAEGKIEARELKLYIENDSALYRQRYLPIIRNLSKHMAKDRYKDSLAVKAFMYLAEAGAKKYIKDFGGDRNTFSKADKIMVAKEFVEEFKDSYDNEEYDFMGKK